MKKISLFLVFIWCFLPFNIALAACSLTCGACAIDDIIADKKIEKPVSAPILKPTVKKDFVEKALEEYEIAKNQSYKEKMPSTLSSADFAWLPDSVEILPSGKNQFQLSWVFMGEIFYSDFSFSSIKEAKSTVESLQSLNLWNKTTTSVKIPEKLFKELRSKGLCKRL